MKIRNMLLIGPVIVIILVIVFSSVVYVSFNKVAEENERESIAQEIHQTVSELDIVMYEYLTYREERMIQQWNLKYNATREIIEKAEVEEEEEEEEWKAAKSNYADLKDLFSKVTSNYEKQGSSELEERLVAKFLIKSYSIISDSSAIAKEAYNDAIEAQETANNSMIIALVVIFVVLVGLSFRIRRCITEPLDKLIKGAKIIGSGNLKHRIDIKTKDELGALASAFNPMTSNLKKSRDEIEEYSKNLEKKVVERTKELEKSKEKLEIKIEALETYRKVTIGRELRMIELKKEIDQLLKKLGEKTRFS